MARTPMHDSDTAHAAGEAGLREGLAAEMRRIAREAAWSRMFGRNDAENPFAPPARPPMRDAVPGEGLEPPSA